MGWYAMHGYTLLAVYLCVIWAIKVGVCSGKAGRIWPCATGLPLGGHDRQSATRADPGPGFNIVCRFWVSAGVLLLPWHRPRWDYLRRRVAQSVAEQGRTAFPDGVVGAACAGGNLCAPLSIQ
jgi:hypothetical protein